MVKIDPGKVSASKKRLFQIQSEKRSRTKRPVPVVANKFTKVPSRLASFEKGMSGHDDGPDADEGAIYILQKRTRTEAFDAKIGTYKNSKYLW